MSVEAATAQMANTTLNEPTSTAEGASVGAGGDKPINASQNEAVIASAAEGRRLYIGNLAYATTEGELKDFFKDYLVYVQHPLMDLNELETNSYSTVRPPLSPPTRAPLARSATPSWRSRPRPRPSVPSPSSTARPSLTARSRSSWPALLRLTPRALAAAPRVTAPRTAAVPPPVDADVAVAVVVAEAVADVL